MMPDLGVLTARFSEQMSRIDEVAHVVLKGHLLLEEALTRILEQYVFHREYLEGARLSFYDKMQLCRSLCLRKADYLEWDLLGALNALRNELAHTLDSPGREKKLSRVKVVYVSATRSGKIKEETQPADIIFLACAHCAGFLASFEADSRAFRQIVHSIDRSLNPESPEFEAENSPKFFPRSSQERSGDSRSRPWFEFTPQPVKMRSLLTKERGRISPRTGIVKGD